MVGGHEPAGQGGQHCLRGFGGLRLRRPFGFTAGFAPEMIGPMIVGKLVGGVSAIAVAMWLTGEGRKVVTISVSRQKSEIPGRVLTKTPAPGYNGAVYFRSCEEKSTLFLLRKRAPEGARGCGEGSGTWSGAEPSSGDSPQADGSGSSCYRRLRYGQNARANQGGTASVFVALG